MEVCQKGYPQVKFHQIDKTIAFQIQGKHAFWEVTGMYGECLLLLCTYFWERTMDQDHFALVCVQFHQLTSRGTESTIQSAYDIAKFFIIGTLPSFVCDPLNEQP